MRLGIEQQNRRALERLHREMAGPFDVSAAARVLGEPADRTRSLLRYLAARGWLSRVRRGLYATVPLGAAEPSAWREDPWRIAVAVFEPCYIGGWSACEHWELTEQVFRGVVVLTARPVRASDAEVQGTAFRLKHVPESKQFGTRIVWRDRVQVKVSDPARTVVDILDAPLLGGGIRHVASVLRVYLTGPHRNDKQLVQYADRLGNRTVFKRMGHLIEALGLSADKLTDACRARVSKGLSLLDPGVDARGRVLKRWGLRVNVELAAEEPS